MPTQDTNEKAVLEFSPFGQQPKFDTADLLEIANKKYPNIGEWYNIYPDMLSIMLDVETATDHNLMEASSKRCGLGNYQMHSGNTIPCSRDSEFAVFALLFLNDGNKPTPMVREKIQWYCSPCLYTTMYISLGRITGGERLMEASDNIEEKEGYSHLSRIIEGRIDFIENCVGRSAGQLQITYPNSEELLQELYDIWSNKS